MNTIGPGTHREFAVTRVNPDGSLDRSFGVDGKALARFGAKSFEIANAMAIQRDGSIVVGGTVSDTFFDANFGLVRFNVKGSIDTSFGVDGKVIQDLGPDSTDRLNGLAVQSDRGCSFEAPSNSSNTEKDSALAGTPMTAWFAAGCFIERRTHMSGHTRVSALSQRIASVIVFVLIIMGAPGLAGLARAQDGQLDPTFGTGGKVTTDFGGLSVLVTGVASQRDGKIVAVGTISTGGPTLPDLAIARYNVDGTLDASFGIGGKVTTDLEGSDDRSAGVVIQPDGKIVVVATAITGDFQQQFTDFAVVRYKTNGALDLSFGAEGKAIIKIGPKGLAAAGAVALQSDGKIIVGGRRLLTFSTSDFVLVRYNADGSIDTSFGADGKVFQDVRLGGANRLTGLAVQPDGRILAAGAAAGNGIVADVVLVRFMPDGQADASFGSGGIVLTIISPANDAANAITLQADGRIVIAGFADVGQSRNFALARYSDTGALDGSFGDNGIVTTSFAGKDGPNPGPNGIVNDQAVAVKIQADGKIVAGGSHLAQGVPDGPGTDFALARYRKDGSLDPSFGIDGRITTGFTTGSQDIAAALTIQSDGKIVVAGVVLTNGSRPVFGLARYQASSTRGTF